MRRLHVIMPNADSCRSVVKDFKQQGIPGEHLHVVASIAQQDLEDLPEASVWQKTELAHGIEWGLGLGGVAGLIGGVLAVSFPPAGLVLGGGAIMAGVAGGAGFGAIVSAMLGVNEHSHELDQYQQQIASGKLLLMADVPRGRVEELSELILKHHPEADIGVKLPQPGT